ncbi:uncharacterized protein LOC134695346 [Mytilus trossulus]|uniref:uncharacterized protein LOC134695346 n=1 Tax=Mytilus trossulus TaxID=6551 RepID=UPI0030045BFD
MTDLTEPGPVKRPLPLDLQMEEENIQIKVPRVTGPPPYLDDKTQKWLIVGICLQTIISPVLRKYADDEVNSLYESLKSSNSINTNDNRPCIDKYRTNKYKLNFKSINNNWEVHKNSYNYTVTSHVDLSKLFLLPTYACYTAIDESCDLTALLSIVININSFPSSVQTDAEKIRSDIRNHWAHCDLREWTATKYIDSFHLMEQLLKNIGLNTREEGSLRELNTWATYDQNVLSGTTLGPDIVQKNCNLSKCVQSLCSETDSQFVNRKVLKELLKINNKLQQRNKILEALHRLEIKGWEEDKTTFLETRATHHILELLPFKNCIIVTGCSGCGKSSNIHHAALHLRDSYGFEIIPVLKGPTDIIDFYNEEKKQVFVVDDIYGKETLNTSTLQTWSDHLEKTGKLFTDVGLDVADKKDGTVSNMSSPKMLISCRLDIYKESQFQHWLESGSVSPWKDDRLQNIVEVFGKDLSKEKHRKDLKSSFSILNGTYLKLRGKEYSMIHDKIHKMAAVICGQNLTECFMKYAPPEFIRDHFIFASLLEVHESDDSIVLLELQEEKKYFERLICDLKDRVITSTFHNNQLIYEKFREKLINFLRSSDNAKTVLKKFDTQHAQGCQIYDGNEKMRNTKYEIQKYLMNIYYTTPLIESAIRGYFDIVHFLIVDVKCNVNYTDCNNCSPLHKASERGHRAVAELLLDNNASVNHCNRYGESSLYVACAGGHTDTVKLLLEHNADVIIGLSPLYVACKGGNKDIVELLLDKDASISQCFELWRFPLYEACKGGHTYIVKLLLQKGASINQCFPTYMSPLYVACKGGHTDIVEMLLQKNNDVDKSDVLMEDPFVSYRGGFQDTVEMLLQTNDYVNQCNEDGKSPLYVACKGGHINTVKILLKNTANVFQCNMQNQSPLYAACKGGHKGIVELLLKKDTGVNQCDTGGCSLLYVACARGHTDTVELLLKNGADFNQCNTQDESPLYAACGGGHKDAVNMLLEKDADVNQTDATDCSPLYVACRGGHIHIVQLLLQKKADVNHCNTSGQSPLFVACQESHKETVELLLKKEDNINQCDLDGKSPLFAACEGRYTCELESVLQNNEDVYQYSVNACKLENNETVELLLKNEAKVNQCDQNGDSPLFAACRRGHKETVELLLKEKADVNQCNSEGESPLHAVCSYHYHLQSFYSKDRVEPVLKRYIETVKILLAWGADVKMFNRNGQTPLDIVRESHFVEIVNLFEKNLQLKKSQLK